MKRLFDILDIQNYIGASEFVISKAEVLEDTHIINEIKKRSNTKFIKLEKLTELDYLKIKL